MKTLQYLFFFLILSGILFAQNSQKIGWVNSEIILQQYPPAIKAQSDLDALTAKWTKSLDSMTTALQTSYAEAQKQFTNMTPDKQREVQQDLVQKEQSMQQFRQQKFGQPNGELFIRQEEFLKPIKAKILDAIDAVRQTEGMNFVFDKTADVLILYADPKYDITNAVLDRLKRG
ncbi:MAG: OmpH family outer membrane protein [Ignavibacteriae bacterium]|nr:OmpH family outer membrane protein [Ignavibacteriota bacterium]MCB9210085.1 OmpH family outer membrane protein [Ignavibacteriales bacterium]MCB9218530.1 OmpH family outer membrane protein [Ignavibacteriales bacterium]MCB9259464.1 OmpH family outer membrane protein [Ignavibacteriales bacterium]